MPWSKTIAGASNGRPGLAFVHPERTHIEWAALRTFGVRPEVVGVGDVSARETRGDAFLRSSTLNRLTERSSTRIRGRHRGQQH
ncbi:MAG: hypothetical protein ACJAXA_002486 [Candidatus Aldehydirespiratoraceae bacterium]|jgi:hypothetical protein